MATQTAKIEAGHVYLPEDALWLGEFLSELLAFPNGRHDGQVDRVYGTASFDRRPAD
jgi:predicted phage terminase large subunit-like protein